MQTNIIKFWSDKIIQRSVIRNMYFAGCIRLTRPCVRHPSRVTIYSETETGQFLLMATMQNIFFQSKHTVNSIFPTKEV